MIQNSLEMIVNISKYKISYISTNINAMAIMHVMTSLTQQKAFKLLEKTTEKSRLLGLYNLSLKD